MARPITSEEFEHLYRTTAPELFGYLRRRGIANAEDLVAEVYTIAWRRRADLPAAFLRRAWLFGTARKILLSQSRQRGREQSLIEHAAMIATAETPTPNPQVQEAVTEALGRLTPEERELILLVEWERMTPAEVATVLDIRPGTARVRLHRARQSLAADPALQEFIKASRHPTTEAAAKLDQSIP